jgi:iron complex outermembrane receptor protein
MRRIDSVKIQVLCSVSMTVAFASTASAQTASTSTNASTSNDGSELQEVVVSAQRRSERLQDVPISVDAFTSKDLETAGVSGTLDLPIVTPGLVFGQQAGVAQPFLRGIGTVAAGPGIENPVALYVDNVYYGSPFGQIMAFTNIDQVEVDKGPQGTLFGRNASGGLIQVTTKDPSQTFGGSLSETYGNYATSTTDGYITGGLTSDLSSDLAIHFLHQGDGYGINIVTGEPVGKTQDMAFRNKWLLNTADGTQVKLIFDYDVTHFIPNYTDAPGTTPFGPPSYPVPPQDVDGPYQPFGNTHTGGASAQIQQDLDFARFVSISAYRRTVLDVQGSAQLTDDPLYTISSVAYEKSAQMSQEFQLLSLPGARINWTTGTYLYYDNAGSTPPTIESGGLVAPFSNIYVFDHQKAYSVAIYGQATTAVAVDTNLTVGLRYTGERRNYEGSELALIPDTPPYLVEDEEHKIYQKPTWRIALDHHFDPDVMAYVSYNRGFKSGGFNDTLVPTSAFAPEVVDAYEAGLKNTLFDRHVTLDATGFFYNYKGIQAFQYFANGSALVYNAGSARLYGLDLDAKFKFVDNLTITTAFEALHTAYTYFPDAAVSTPIPGGGTAYTTGSAEGHHLPFSPAETTSLSADYVIPLATLGSLNLNVTYLYNSGFFGEPDNRLRQPSYEVLNSQIAWNSPGDSWVVRLWGRNLNNEEYTTSIGSQPNGDFAVFAPPRTYGVTVSRTF